MSKAARPPRVVCGLLVVVATFALAACSGEQVDDAVTTGAPTTAVTGSTAPDAGTDCRDEPVGPVQLLERGEFVGEASCTDRIAVEPARDRFMMHQHRPRLVERLPTAGVQSQAQIDIVEGDHEIRRIEPADS